MSKYKDGDPPPEGWYGMFAQDLNIECASKTDKCFIEINRGYKCKKHKNESTN